MRYVMRKSKGGFFSEGRLFVTIEGLQEGMELTETQAMIALLDQIDSLLIEVAGDVNRIWKET